MYRIFFYRVDDDGIGLYIEDEEEKDFDTLWQALAYATRSNLPYEIYRDFFYISAVKLVARSHYELWEY